MKKEKNLKIKKLKNLINSIPGYTFVYYMYQEIKTIIVPPKSFEFPFLKAWY